MNVFLNVFLLSFNTDHMSLQSCLQLEFSSNSSCQVWDIKDQVCMLTIRPKTHKIRGDLQACHYNRVAKGFCIATDQVALLSHRANRIQQHGEVVYTHKEPVHCAKYNPSFKHIVSCSDGSVSLRIFQNKFHFIWFFLFDIY